ncbi:Wzz/FepE/Etk N-terminal domain-containing protein [Aetokthonos hydrillicola Thurmond2011]|uniref:Wzz/FepE/Etk N-terminal domain-containing protein n=1 Tax=Aetokthonos hydrillicola Thurmond2011 TaxID=2712845 RepID=A0AAP5I814_9CYAN|nr:tyrosine-protein kinase domain-containing protein [Aetokthonos hydrillicola]MBO3458837.1 chain-length determining protein [Aetokthonos hydrillicola CCALA 1050]MBW4587316.1 chain-length determining protein [Aetokthonos hydrillicola CCALA 1050]MDR9896662.1 Wzz/FepE/Etk N-terminal domain-containing protein [Aetokthonos hydrillicola Thurmond2011]
MADTSLEHGSKQGRLIVLSPHSTINIRQAFTIVHRRRFLILGVSCAVISVGTFLALTTKPTYQSSMQILVSSHSNKGVDSTSQKNNVKIMDYTQLMVSSMMIEKAVDLLRSSYPNITVEEIKGKNGKQKYLVIKKIEEHREANQLLSQLLDVSFKGNDPLKTQKVLQVLEKVYIDHNTEQQKERLAKGLSLFNDQLPKIKNQLIQSEKNLQQFRQKNNLLDPEKQGKLLLQSLADTRKQLRVVRAQIQDAKARNNYLHKQLTSLHQKTVVSSVANQSKNVQTLLDEIHHTEEALAQERQRYTDDSPVVKTLLQKHESQMAVLREDVGRSSKGSGSADSLGQSPQTLLPAKAVEETSGKPSPLTNSSANLSEGNQQGGERLMTTPIDKVSKVVERRNVGSSKIQVSFTTQVPSNNLSPSGTENIAMTQVQIAGVNQKMVEDLIDVQKTETGLTANEKSLVESEQQINSELSKYQNLMAQYKRLLPEVETNRKTLEKLIAAQHSLALKIAEENLNLEVLEQPQPGISLGSNRLLFLFGGILLAPVLGIAAGLLREFSDDTIHSPQDLRNLINVRLLGTVPKLPLPLKKRKFFSLPRGAQTSPSKSLKVTSNDNFLDIYNFLPAHETLDIAFQNIQNVQSADSYKSLMLTSALAGEGKSTLILGLALSATHMNRRVLIVDANLRKPNLHKILEIPNEWGLSLLLIDETLSNFRDYIQPIHPSIDVLTAGPVAEDPVMVLSSSRMQQLVNLFKQTYDLVLIDTSSILDTVDARLVASTCDAIAMVARLGKLTQAKLTQATEIFSDSKLNLIGIIANEVSLNQKKPHI